MKKWVGKEGYYKKIIYSIVVIEVTEGMGLILLLVRRLFGVIMLLLKIREVKGKEVLESGR